MIHHPRHHALSPPIPRAIQRDQIERPHARQQIHLGGSHEHSSFEFRHGFPENEEGDDDDGREVLFEEGLGTACGVAADGLSLC